jgi:hypothetical protein
MSITPILFVLLILAMCTVPIVFVMAILWFCFGSVQTDQDPPDHNHGREGAPVPNEDAREFKF